MITKESNKLHISVDNSGLHAPPSVEEKGYKAAMWGGFAFGVLGTVLAAIFLRGVGIVGHQKQKVEVGVEADNVGRMEEVEDEAEELDDEESQSTAAGIGSRTIEIAKAEKC